MAILCLSPVGMAVPLVDCCASGIAAPLSGGIGVPLLWPCCASGVFISIYACMCAYARARARACAPMCV
eukprot:scaffold163365_cov20-Tisochrysis_lutea.AAC.3